MWEPRRLTTLWAFTACYRDSFALSRASIARGKLVRFVYALITVFVSSIEARQPRPAVDRRHKTVSTERAENTEIPLPRDREPLRFGSTRAEFARGNMVSTLRGKATNIVSSGGRAQSIPGSWGTHGCCNEVHAHAPANVDSQVVCL
jgi:hypothetical protein